MQCIVWQVTREVDVGALDELSCLRIGKRSALDHALGEEVFEGFALRNPTHVEEEV